MTRAAIYARVSTDGQAERSTIDNQIDACHAYIKRNGWEAVVVIKDEGVSGATPFADRPGGRELMALAESHEVDKVVILCADRLARNNEDIEAHNRLHRLLAPAPARKTKKVASPWDGNGGEQYVLYVTQSFDGTPAGEMMLTIFLAVAKYERSEIARRTRAGRERHVKEGQLYAAPIAPFGYRRTENKLIEEDPETAPVVRQMFDLAAGGLGAKAIGLRLDEMGIRPPMVDHPRRKGQFANWNWSTIHKILRNPRYIGNGSYGGIEMPCPAIVDPLVFKQVQDGVALRKSRSKRATQHEYLLQFLGACGTCGGNLASQTNGNGWRNYYCFKRAHYPRELGPMHEGKKWRWHADEIEVKVVAELKRLLTDPENYSDVIEVEADKFKAGLDAAALKIREAERELNEAEGERERLLELFQKGYIGEVEMARKLPDVEKRRKALQQARYELGTTPDAVERMKSHADQYIAWIMTLKLEDLASSDFATQRKVITGLVERVQVHADGSIDVHTKHEVNASVLMPVR